jgi:hypothetical protein
MILMQIKDNDDNTKTIIQHIENVLIVEYNENDEILYITRDNLHEVQSTKLLEGCRITIK